MQLNTNRRKGPPIKLTSSELRYLREAEQVARGLSGLALAARDMPLRQSADKVIATLQSLLLEVVAQSEPKQSAGPGPVDEAAEAERDAVTDDTARKSSTGISPQK